MPRSFAASRRTRCGFCVGVQISQRPDDTRAIVLPGSTEAWAWNPSRYVAENLAVAPASAASTSPDLRDTWPGRAAASSRRRQRSSVESAAFGPSSQTTSSASRPPSAAQLSSPRTATPFAIATAPRTPGNFFAFAASKRTSLPPATGHRAIAANSMSGARVSSPYLARPVTIAGPSIRGTRVPTIRKSFGSLSGGSFGTGSFAASPARAPKPSRRPVGACTTNPFSARHSPAGDFHRCAAAATSISRAAAPALRSTAHEEITLSLPPVFMSS